MNILHQSEPVDKGPGNVIGKLIDPQASPIAALETIRLQVEKVREWNGESAMEAIDQAKQNLQGMQLTLECLEMQLTTVLLSPMVKYAIEMMQVLDSFTEEYERGPEWVSADTFDRAVRLLRKVRDDEQHARN